MENNFTSNVKQPWTTYDNRLIQEKTVFKKATQKLCYMFLCSYANAKSIFPSMDSIADACCISPRNAMRIIEELEQLGFIEVTRKQGLSNKYVLNDYFEVAEKITRDKMSLVTKCHGGSDKMSPLPVTKCHPKTKTKTKNEKENSSSSAYDKIDNDLKEKYPNAPFDIVKQNLLNDSTATINTINQYSKLLEYRLKNYKEPKPKKPTTKKSIRKEMIPDFMNEEKKEEKKEESPQMTREEFELEKAKIKERNERLKQNRKVQSQ
jgi:hypothetical protein